MQTIHLSSFKNYGLLCSYKEVWMCGYAQNEMLDKFDSDDELTSLDTIAYYEKSCKSNAVLITDMCTVYLPMFIQAVYKDATLVRRLLRDVPNDHVELMYPCNGKVYSHMITLLDLINEIETIERCFAFISDDEQIAMKFERFIKTDFNHLQTDEFIKYYIDALKNEPYFKILNR